LQVIDSPLHLTTAFADHHVGLHISGSHYIHANCGGRPAQGRSDPEPSTWVIEEIMIRLSFEAKSEAPTVQLYAESAGEFLAHHIVHTYSSLSTPPLQLSGGELRCGTLPNAQESASATLSARSGSR
jgi:hypothetical protein